MRDKDRQLAEACGKWAQCARDAEKWLVDNRERVGECDWVCKELRTNARMYGRLAKAALRKMCVGVFGPSQAGKSYLISVLAKDRQGDLITDFMGKRVDFLRDINPQGGKESTGLVTRFTTTMPEGITEDKPVRLRLFSEMDLVRVFANTYYADCDHKKPPVLEEIKAALKDLEKYAANAPVSRIGADDIEDLREYLQKNFASRPRLQQLSVGVYWEKAMHLAPRLRLSDRKRLFGLIWDNVPEFDNYYYTLAKALEDMDNPSEVNCPVEALLPRSQSIIDVALLAPDAPGANEKIELATLDGKKLALPRCHVTALTAELTIFMPEEPDPFFAYTDLLDFPGYRSRLKTNDLKEALLTPGALEKTFFLRGKVAYLFERYCEEQELTSMLLCIGPSNQEVQDLPGAINNWISLTQGETPQTRRGHEPTLFFILTKVDMEFARKRGADSSTDEADNANSWDIRMGSSLTNFFGAQYDWPGNWDGRPFRNVFLLRNPNFLCDAVFTFDANGRELSIRDDMRDTVEKVHSDFLSSQLVRDHFEDPEESWQAAIKLNDGGIELLRKKLAPICDPDRKYNQTRDRALEIRQKIVSRLDNYYNEDDVDERRKQKEKIGQELVKTLSHLVGRQVFADFLSRFIVNDQELFRMASELPEMFGTGDMDAAPKEEAGQSVVGTAIDGEDLFGDLFGSQTEPDAPARVEDKPASRSETETDEVSSFCNKAMNHWFDQVRAQAENPLFPRIYGVTSEFLESFTTELILGARHAKVLESMTEAIRRRSRFSNITREVAAWRMASEAACRINSFVSWLGHDVRLGEKTETIFQGRAVDLFVPPNLQFGPDGEPVVPEEQGAFDRGYYMSWFQAFYNCVVGSLTERVDGFDPIENQKLGAIIKSLKAARENAGPPGGPAQGQFSGTSA